MKVNEETEILSKLGILPPMDEGSYKSQIATASIVLGGGSAWSDAVSSDDESSGSSVVFQSLLESRHQGDAMGKQSRKWSCLNGCLLTPFILIGMLTSVVSVSLPNIAVNTHASSFLYILELLSCIAAGHFVGVLIAQYLSRFCKPLAHITLMMFGVTTATLMIAFLRSTHLSFMCSFFAGLFYGSVDQVGVMSVYSGKHVKRPAYAAYAAFALGAVLISAASIPFFSEEATPYARYLDRYSDNMSLLRHVLSRRDLEAFRTEQLAGEETSGDALGFNSSHEQSVEPIALNDTVQTTKSLRPDHVVGVLLVEEPKSMENKQKRKEAEAHLSGLADGLRGSITSSLQQSTPEPASRALPVQEPQTTEAHSSTPSAAVVQSTLSLNPSSGEVSRQGDESASVTDRSTGVTAGGRWPPVNSENSVMFVDLNWEWKVEGDTYRLLRFMRRFLQKESLNNVELIYLLASALCLSLLFQFLVCSICFQRTTMAALDKEDVQYPGADPSVGFDDKLWHLYVTVFFALTGGAESLISNALMFYSLVTPELKFSQRDASIFIAFYWAGIFISRLLALASGRIMPVNRLLFFLVGMASLCTYVAFSVLSFWTFAGAMFVLGSLLALQTPSMLSWLHEQETSSSSSLACHYGLGVSLGRLILPWIAAVVVHAYSSPPLLFVLLTVLTICQFVTLLFTVKSVVLQSRFRAIDRLADANAESVGTVIQQRDARRGKYIALLNESEDRTDPREH